MSANVYFKNTSGIISNPLLQRMSYRKVAILGVLVFLVGLCFLMFVSSFYQFLIISFAIQGVGFSLIMSSTLTAFNYYFEERRNFVLSVSNVILTILSSTFPSMITYCMKNYGSWGTQLIVIGLNLNCIPAVLCLQPVKWHMKRRPVQGVGVLEVNKTEANNSQAEQSLRLLNTQKQEYNRQFSNKFVADSRYLKNDESICLNIWRRFSSCFDLGLLLDPIYLNISLGLSLCLTSDYVFLTILPVMLSNLNLDLNNITMLMTVFYASDIAGRILLAILNAFTHFQARTLTLIGAIFAMIFRIALVMDRNFWWLTVCLGLLGSLRCFFQVNYPLIIADYCKERFAAAFTLLLVLCGIVSLISGLLIGVIKASTESNLMIVYFLAALYGVCVFSWVAEILYSKRKRV